MQKSIYLSIVGVFLLCSFALADLFDNGDHTVTDTATGLMWQQIEVVNTEGTVREMTWEEALNYCNTLELAGYDDWRLPNINELRSIVDYNKTVDYDSDDPPIDKVRFPNAIWGTYWSSTTYADKTYKAWVIRFNNHGRDGVDDKLNSYYVRAVRSGL
jgi:hypothetical protein